MIWQIHWNRLPRQLRYVLVGGFNTACGYGLFALCYLSLERLLPYMMILVLSHLLAVSFSFTTHRLLVFTGAGLVNRFTIGHAWLRFQLSYLGLLGLGLGVNWLMLRYATSSVWLAQGASTATGVVVGYLVHSRITFQRQDTAEK